MKIIHIIEATATGTLSMAALLARAQEKNGHAVSVIYSRRPETPLDLSELFGPSISLIQVQMYSPIEKVTCVPKLRRVLKAMSPGVVFMHSSFAGFFGRLSSIFALNNSKLFYIPHCISFMRNDIWAITRLLFVIFEWVGSIRKSSYIACSESEQSVIRSAIPFRECFLVENALDLEAMPKAPFRSNKLRKRVVITVGQIRAQKGPDDFAKIARAVRATHSDTKFIWVGDGDLQLRMNLESAGVRVTGWAPKNEVWSLLRSSSVYLSTARWEGMPVSLIEAGFIGIPVIASACAGNVDVIEHGETGWLFKTTGEAVGLIQKALEDTAESNDISRRAFETAHQRFNVDRYFNEMEYLVKK